MGGDAQGFRSGIVVPEVSIRNMGKGHANAPAEDFSGQLHPRIELEAIAKVHVAALVLVPARTASSRQAQFVR